DRVSAHFDVRGLTREWLSEASFDQPETHGVNVDVVTSPFFCQGSSESKHSRFSGGVAGLSRVAVGGGNGGDVHHLPHDLLAGCDFTFGSFTEVGRGRAQNTEWHDEMDFEHGLELLVRSFLNDIIPTVSGIVHDNVDGPKSVESGLNQFAGKIRLGEIAGEDPDPPSHRP